MGAEPYWYFETYEGNVAAALKALRAREFAAGRYNPVIPSLWSLFPIGPHSPAPGPQHASIDEALEAAAEDGTRSILDLDHTSEEPDFCAVAPLPTDVLKQLFGTTQPTREMVEANMAFMDDMERGQGVYIILYQDGQPTEVFFAGFSFD